MSKEVSYIWRGFFFLLVVLAGMGIVQLLIPSKKSSVGPVSAGLPAAPGNTISSPSYNSHGQLLFQANCAVCHPIDRNVEHMDILDIAHVEDRVKDKVLLRAWIRNSDSVLKTGNPYFNALYERWNKAAKPAFPNLSDQDIDEILEYIWRHRKK